jgi:thioredoxin 1
MSALVSVSRDNWDAEVIEASHAQPVLVDFWGPTCGPCIQLMPWVEDLAARSAGSLKVVEVNASEHRRLSVDLRVMGLPTFAVYRDGAEVRRLSGSECTPSALLEAVSAASAE